MFGTGKTLESLDWVWYSYIWLRGSVLTTVYVMKIVMTGVTWSFTFVFERESFEFGAYDIMHDLSEMSFGWCFITYLVFWKMCSSWIIFWSRMWSGTMNTRKCSTNPYNVAMWVDEMPCRKGVWKLITLWVRVTSDMPFLIVVATCFIIVQLYARKIGRQQSAYCCWRDCAVDLQVGHNILLVLDLQAFVTF